jgi:DNA-binding CsgD family transcriptional regulator
MGLSAAYTVREPLIARRAAWSEVWGYGAMDGRAALPLRGRQEELSRVQRRLEEVRSGVGAVVVVEGRAGLGKTRLLDACASLASGMSFRVGQGMAEPGRSVVDLGALLDAMFDGEDPLVARHALSSLHSSPEQAFWLLHDLQALLEEAALANALLVCLDDLQWAGSSLALAMRRLPKRLASLPVAWVMAFRPDQGPPAAVEAKQELLEAGAEFISLGPLDREAVADVAADVLGAEPDEQLLEKAERVHGSPFLLVEFFRGLQDEGIVSVASGRATLLDDRVPHRVTDGIQRRLSRMSPEAERVATVAASLGRRFSVGDLGQMSGIALTELLEPVRDLLNADILTDTDGHLAFCHDLIREGARSSSPSAVRRGLDRQAVDVLLARGVLPVEVAQQLATSAEPGDDMAIATLLEVANTLGVTDPSAAADLTGRALELAPARHPLRGPLVARRAISMFAAGFADDARRFADTALRQSLPPEEEARVRWTIAGMFNISPDIRADNARRALALPELSAETRALLWASLFHNLVVAVRTDEALAVREKARYAVEATESGAGSFALEVAESGLQYQLSRFEQACDVLERAQPLSLPDEQDARHRLADTFRASELIALDRFEEAFEVADESVATAQRNRQNWALGMSETWKGRQLLQLGRLSEAATSLEGRFSRGDADRIVAVLEASSVVALGKLKIHHGDDRGVREVAGIAKVMLDASAPGVRRHAAWCLAQCATFEGDAHDAHRWLCTGGTDERLAIFPLFPFEAADDPQLVRIALAVGDDELAQRTEAQAERRSELNPGVKSLAAVAAHARGIATGTVDDVETAVRLFAEGQRPLALASALEDLGRMKVDAGAIKDGTSAFDRALTITTSAGASWDAARLRRRLRRLGVRRRVMPGKRQTTGWGALTAAEVAVADLAAEGRTNRQIAETLFISPHTVNTHLRHVFEKLGLRSRLALSRAAEQQRHSP